MRKISFILALAIMASFCMNAFSQRIEMKLGEPIQVEVLPKNRGHIYLQDGKKLKFTHMCKTLKTVEVCEENITLANKHGKNAGILIGVGILTFPIGYIIVMVPFINQKKKQLKYVALAVEDYNKYLESQKTP